MPEESINIFISNIYAAAIFTGILFLIFLFLFCLSRIFISRTGKKVRKDLTESAKAPDMQGFSSYSINKDIYAAKNLIVLGLIFVFTVFFILLILLTMHFITSFRIDGSTYLIFAIIFLMIVLTVYVVKTRIIDR